MGMKLETLEGSFSAVSTPILQLNTHLKALAEIYAIHIFAQISDLKLQLNVVFLNREYALMSKIRMFSTVTVSFIEVHVHYRGSMNAGTNASRESTM